VGRIPSVAKCFEETGGKQARFRRDRCGESYRSKEEKMMFRFPKTLLVTMAMAACVSGAAQGAENRGTVQGVVRDSSGEPLAGAFVKLKNAERHLTFMVITQGAGRYAASNLPPGSYTVQGIGNGFQSAAEPVNVTAGGKATANLPLTAPQAPALPHGWPGMPGNSNGGEGASPGPPPNFPEGAGKQITITKCAQCHDLRRVANNHADPTHWKETIQTMRDYVQSVVAATDLTDQEAAAVLDYLAANFPADGSGKSAAKPDPNSRLPRTALKGAATKYIAVEYEIPIADVEPHEITVDTKGNGWVSERRGGHLGKFDVNTFAFTEVSPPPAASKSLHLNGIVRGEGDTLWLVDGGPNRRWLHYDVKTGEFNVFIAPKVKLGSPTANTMRVASDGTVWLAGIASNQIVGLTPTTKKFVAYDVPSGVAAKRNATPYGMAIAGDGKVWFAENSMNKMGRLDPATGKIDEFDIPVKNAVARKVGADSSGNIWVGLHNAGKLMKVDYKTAQMTVYSPPTENAGVYSIQGDPGSALVWMSEQMSDAIARFDPKTETFVEFPLPSAESDPRRIEVDPTNPNRIWWTGNSSNKLGYIELLSGNGE
jgi:virginiamycin B lyase